MVTRVQLGAGRLEDLHPKVIPVFLDETWVHLGNPERNDKPSPIEKSLKGYSFSYLTKIYRRFGVSYILKRGFQKAFWHSKESTTMSSQRDEIYRRTNFREFYYQKGDTLPFEDSSTNYIFSEHFFEHLFLDEALSLLKECYRILRPFGVVRVCVPDADLRTYEPPEPVGFPDIKLPFTHHSKHKTRWSVYSLAEVLRVAGFDTLPLRYCNESGQYIRVEPTKNRKAYERCPDQEMVFDLSYINRIDSLIIDGLKEIKTGGS